VPISGYVRSKKTNAEAKVALRLRFKFFKPAFIFDEETCTRVKAEQKGTVQGRRIEVNTPLKAMRGKFVAE
jgi:hypothetical protein